MNEAPPLTPVPVQTLGYAQTDETRWWRRFILCLAAFGIIVGVAELSSAVLMLWSVFADPSMNMTYWYEQLMDPGSAKAVMGTIGAASGLCAAVVLLGCVALLMGRDWRGPVMAAALCVTALDLAVNAMQVIAMVKGPSPFGRQGLWLVYMLSWTIRSIAGPMLLGGAFLAQRRNPALAACFR